MSNRVCFVLMPGFQLMALTVPPVFEAANLAHGTPIYDVHFVSEKGGIIKSSAGISVSSEKLGDSTFDSLIVAGGSGEPSPELIAYIRDAAGTSCRIASICMGAFVLAKAGILEGRRVTAHWQSVQGLKSLYPKAKVYGGHTVVVDGTVWTSAGVSAGIELALGMVEADHGVSLACAVAKYLLASHRCVGGRAQYGMLPEPNPKTDRMRRALRYAKDNLCSTLTVERLAAAVDLSPRQFGRAFVKETGLSPAKAIERLRVEAARCLLEQRDRTIELVAAETGFRDPDRMRRAFLRSYGQPPQVVRRNARFETVA